MRKMTPCFNIPLITILLLQSGCQLKPEISEYDLSEYPPGYSGEEDPAQAGPALTAEELEEARHGIDGPQIGD